MLCDIGNSTYHFYDNIKEHRESVSSFDPESIVEKVFYISVNSHISQKLATLDNWVDLQEYMKLPYESMGIDRAVALLSICDGVVIDAGSAITVDVVHAGVFEGGFIYLGIESLQRAYADISSALQCSFNFELAFDTIPYNTVDAITYGAFAPLVQKIRSFDLPVILTGGDASRLQRLLPEAKVDEMLIFKGMQELIRRENIC